jgi:hypothetical protein
MFDSPTGYEASDISWRLFGLVAAYYTNLLYNSKPNGLMFGIVTSNRCKQNSIYFVLASYKFGTRIEVISPIERIYFPYHPL